MRFMRLHAVGRAVGIVAALALLAAPGGFPVPDVQAQERAERATLTVTGSGRAESVPDMAIVTSGVLTQGQTVAEALADNSLAMAAVIEALETAGVDARDIQTANFSITPEYDRGSSSSQYDTDRIVGYRVFNDVTVRIRDVRKAGELLDKVVSLGANRIRGISFTVSNRGEMEEAARRSAVEDALATARLIADTAGFKLGRLVRVTDNSFSFDEPRPVGRARAQSLVRDDVPIAGGEVISATARITMVFEIIQVQLPVPADAPAGD